MARPIQILKDIGATEIEERKFGVKALVPVTVIWVWVWYTGIEGLSVGVDVAATA